MIGKLIVLSGPSGTGKDTVRRELFKKYPHLEFSISCTTRPKRETEIEGVNYYFLTYEQFMTKVKANQMLEFKEFASNWYGTPKDKVDNAIAGGKDILLEIECQGALEVIAKVPDCLSIFLTPPSIAELERRLRTRATEDESAIIKRLAKATEEMQLKNHYRYTVVNTTVNQAVTEIDQIFQKEGIKSE